MPGTQRTEAAGAPAAKADESMLVTELRSAGQDKIADKVAKTEALLADVSKRPREKRVLSKEEAKVQRDNALSADETIAMQRVEYGTWVADEPIDSDSGARAYNVGDPVPISNVVLHEYHKTNPSRVRRVEE